MLITVCDVLEERRPDVERAGGEVVRIWHGLMDVQFKEHRFATNNLGVLSIHPLTAGALFRACNCEYSNVYIH